MLSDAVDIGFGEWPPEPSDPGGVAAAAVLPVVAI